MSRQAEDCEYFSVKQTESVDTLSLLNLSQKKGGIYPVENALKIVGNPVETVLTKICWKPCGDSLEIGENTVKCTRRCGKTCGDRLHSEGGNPVRPNSKLRETRNIEGVVPDFFVPNVQARFPTSPLDCSSQ
jgi:hypothetical protein